MVAALPLRFALRLHFCASADVKRAQIVLGRFLGHQLTRVVILIPFLALTACFGSSLWQREGLLFISSWLGRWQPSSPTRLDLHAEGHSRNLATVLELCTHAYMRIMFSILEHMRRTGVGDNMDLLANIDPHSSSRFDTRSWPFAGLRPELD